MKRLIYVLLVVWLFLLTVGIFGIWYSLRPDPEMTPIVETVIVEKVETVIVETEPEVIEVIKEVPVEVLVQPTEAPKERITFFDGGWESLSIINAIAIYIIQHGYGYPAEEMTVSSDTMMVYLPLGDMDVNMELWRAGAWGWYERGVSGSRLIDLGAIYERSTQGWYVPRYVVEGVPERGIEALAPGLKSVEDLPEYWEIFKDPNDPNKGVFVTCVPGWRCNKVNRLKFTYYGLDEQFNMLEPESGDDLNDIIANAYGKGEAVLTYYWEPTGLMGRLDMVLLEEPAYTDTCWAEIEAAIEEDPPGTINQSCAFPGYDIHKGVYGGLLDRAPDVVIFLKNMFVGTERLNELGAYKMNNNLTPGEVALYYLKNHQNEWSMWVPADVAEKVQATLE